MSRSVLMALTAMLALAAGGCGTSGAESGTPSTASPSATSSSAPSSAALCRAADDLRASLNALQEIDVVQQGTDTLEPAFDQVKSDVTELAAAARDQYAEQVQPVRADADAVQTAVDQARAAPSAQTLGAVATAVRTLVRDTQALLTAVGSAC